jgi:hypothetical protein
LLQTSIIRTFSAPLFLILVFFGVLQGLSVRLGADFYCDLYRWPEDFLLALKLDFPLEFLKGPSCWCPCGFFHDMRGFIEQKY